jgi:hypothetical protein
MALFADSYASHKSFVSRCSEREILRAARLQSFLDLLIPGGKFQEDIFIRVQHVWLRPRVKLEQDGCLRRLHSVPKQIPHDISKAQT